MSAKKYLVKTPDGVIQWSDGSVLIRREGDGLQSAISALTSLGFDDEIELDRSKTQQQFADEVDINNIIARHGDDAFQSREAFFASSRFGDTTLFPEFQDAQNMIAQANQSFAELPAKIRDRFGNDPAKLMQYLSEGGHEAELRELGILNPLPEAPVAVNGAPAEGDSLAAPSAPKGAPKASSEA